MRILGVVIDNKEIGSNHISYISCKVVKVNGIIVKLRKFLNNDSFGSLYYAFVYLHLIIETISGN